MGAIDNLTSADTKMQCGVEDGQDHQKIDSPNTADVKAQANINKPKSMLTIKFTLAVLDPDPGIEKRYVDQAILSMLQDATSGETEPVRMINKRLFRSGESAPLVDAIRINKPFVIRLLGNKA